MRELINRTIGRLIRSTERLNLRWKIYLSLTAILLPVFALTIFVQTRFTRPFLEEDVRQIGTSVCRSLSTDIAAFRLLTKPDQLEARLIEMTWLQPSIARLDVIVKDNASKEPNAYKILASNIVDESPFDFSPFVFSETPQIELKRDKDTNRKYWEILYPIKDAKHILGYVHAEVSLQLITQVVDLFVKIALMGALLATGFLIWLLSYYLRHMIENERKLRKAESENVELTQQLHEMQRQLFLNEKLAIMGHLTASFAHEIGTPLNSLSGHLQLLKDEIKEESSLSRLDVIDSQVSRIEGIVKDFLASTHTPQQQRQLVDVRMLVEKIQRLVEPRLSAIRANVENRIPKDLEPLRVVPSDLEQVLLNLTNNAIDALENGKNNKELIFEATTTNSGQKKTMELTVRDTGEGIASKALKQVLKPFFTTKAPGQGTGLGLTISQRLVKKYGGRLDLDSTLGKGTTVKVSIPYDPS